MICLEFLGCSAGTGDVYFEYILTFYINDNAIQIIFQVFCIKMKKKYWLKEKKKII